MVKKVKVLCSFSQIADKLLKLSTAERLNFATFFCMHSVICLTLGTNSRQNFMASALQARRCSGVPSAKLAVEVTIAKRPASQNMPALF